MNSSRVGWSYFPRSGDTCLLGIEGYAVDPASDIRTGGERPCVSFTLCENVPPYRELRHFRPVRVEKAEAKLRELVFAHVSAKWRG